MAENRISNALDRIDSALARIETQAALARHAPAGNDGDLAARHEGLRRQVESSLGALDALIGSLEQ